MNILGDFIGRVQALYPMDIDNDQLNSLLTTIKNQGDEIEMKTKEIERLQTKIEKIESESDKIREQMDAKKKPAKKPAAKKAPAKKK
jgi:alpha-amylase